MIGIWDFFLEDRLIPSAIISMKFPDEGNYPIEYYQMPTSIKFQDYFGYESHFHLYADFFQFF